MQGIGIAALVLGALMLLFGLFGDTTVSGSDGLGRVHNLGLLGARAAAVTAGSGLIVAGAVFYVGAAILTTLADLREALATSQAPLRSVLPAATLEGASRAPVSEIPASKPGTIPPPFASVAEAPAAVESAPRMPTGADAWKVASAYAEKRGWRVTAGLLGVSLRSPDGRTFKPGSPQEIADLVAGG